MTVPSGARLGPGDPERDPKRAQLSVLAELFEVQTSYVDVDGQERHASPDSLRAVLASLGADVTDAGAAIRAERLRRHTEVLDPVVALPALGAQSLTVALGRHVHPRDCWLSARDEAGSVRRTRLMPAIQRPLGSSSKEGIAVDRFEAQIGSPVSPLEPGYHRLHVEGPGIDASALAVVAPHCPIPSRGWGAFLPLHALRTSSDWGVGTYPALGSMSRWVRSLGGDLVGTLPLYPAFLGGSDGEGTDPAVPVEISPYLPVTRLGWNEIFIDPTVLPELEIAPEVRELIGSRAFQTELEAARAAPFVDYPGVMALVRRALEPLARAAFSARSPSRASIEAFARDRPDMVAYARFRGAGKGGDQGPAGRTDLAGLAGRTDPAGLAGRTGPADLAGMNELSRYHLYAQWAADAQLRAS